MSTIHVLNSHFLIHQHVFYSFNIIIINFPLGLINIILLKEQFQDQPCKLIKATYLIQLK